MGVGICLEIRLIRIIRSIINEPQQPTTNDQPPTANQPKGFNWKVFLASGGCGVIIASLILLPLLGLGIYYFVQHGLPGLYGGSDYGGTFSSDVPEGYREIFLKASEKWKVQPAFVAAIFYAGEHGESWPPFEEHAPLGTSLNPNPHNCDSDVGCIRGPMQIGERNWPGWTQAAYGESKSLERIEWTDDSVFVATWHLAMLGAGGNVIEPAKLLAVAAKYNAGASRPLGVILNIPETKAYVARVMKAFNKFYEAPGGGGDVIAGDWTWPLSGNLVVSGHFRIVNGGCSRQSGDHAHSGTDYSASLGTSILAVANGIVVKNEYDRSYGNSIVLKHQDADGEIVYTRYAHMLNKSSLSIGQSVTVGQEIGKVDHTGNSSGNHLHFEVMIGQLVAASKRSEICQYFRDPETWLPQRISK